jgi:sigma-70-like protein
LKFSSVEIGRLFHLKAVDARGPAGPTVRSSASTISASRGIGMNTDHTLEEIGQQFSVTRERIRRIESRELCKPKHSSRSWKLRSFLDN